MSGNVPHEMKHISVWVTLTIESADVDMAMVWVRLSTRVPSGILLAHVFDCEIVTHHVSDGDVVDSVAVTAERRGYRHVVVQPVDGSTERRCTHDDQLATLVYRPHLVHWLRYRYLTFTVHSALYDIMHYTLWVKKLDLFSFEHNFSKYCTLILIIISLLQTEIICPQTHNLISNFTYSLLLHYLEKCNHILFFTKLLNKSAMHALISLLLQSRKCWWYLLLIASMLLHDVIMTSYCCQRYAECLVTTLCTCNSWTAASRNAILSCVQAVASKQPRSQSCGLRNLGCHAASCLVPQTNPQCGWLETAAHRCLVRS